METGNKIRPVSTRKYLAVLGVFFLFMYIMTFVERFFEENRVPNVDSCTLNYGSLKNGEEKTGKYYRLPSEAVYQDEMGNDYVYLIQEKMSILGNELVCRMKYIDVIARDEKYAAVEIVEGGISNSDLIVDHTDRELMNGCRIHVIE